MHEIKIPIKEIEFRNVNGNRGVFKVPGKVYGLSELELQAVRNATGSFFRISIEIFDLVEVSISSLTFCWPTIIQELEVVQIVDIIENVGYIHTVTPIVLKSASTRYAIGKLATADNRVQNGIGITRFDPGIPCPTSELSVYNSLQELKKDPLYQALTSKQKQNVLKKSNINVISGFIFTKSGDQFDGHFVQHLFLGSFKKGQATGIHHILPILRGDAKIKEIIKPSNKKGVWTARIQVLDKSNRQTERSAWKDKKEPSTFFPNHWNTITLLDECEYALKGKKYIKKIHHNIKWKSKTRSSIPVEIWTDQDEKPISIYPIWEAD